MISNSNLVNFPAFCFLLFWCFNSLFGVLAHLVYQSHHWCHMWKVLLYAIELNTETSYFVHTCTYATNAPIFSHSGQYFLYVSLRSSVYPLEILPYDLIMRFYLGSSVGFHLGFIRFCSFANVW